jgi:uncharacterized membrane protein YdjX (TVP38/TMEM64 family)
LELDVATAGYKKKQRKRSVFIRALALSAFIAAGIYLYYYSDYSKYLTRESISSTIDSIRLFVAGFGFWGSTVFSIAGCVAITINIPTIFVICFAVVVFGGLVGAVVSAISIYMATTLIYFVAQLLGREFVEWAFGERLKKVEDRIQEEGLMTVVYVRLLLFMLPPVNWLLSLTSIRYRDLFLGTLLGTAHMIILSAWLSDMIIDLTIAGESLNPLKTPEMLLPGTIGVVMFVALRIMDRSRRKGRSRAE